MPLILSAVICCAAVKMAAARLFIRIASKYILSLLRARARAELHARRTARPARVLRTRHSRSPQLSVSFN